MNNDLVKRDAMPEPIFPLLPFLGALGGLLGGAGGIAGAIKSKRDLHNSSELLNQLGAELLTKRDAMPEPIFPLLPFLGALGGLLGGAGGIAGAIKSKRDLSSAVEDLGLMELNDELEKLGASQLAKRDTMPEPIFPLLGMLSLLKGNAKMDLSKRDAMPEPIFPLLPFLGALGGLLGGAGGIAGAIKSKRDLTSGLDNFVMQELMQLNDALEGRLAKREASPEPVFPMALFGLLGALSGVAGGAAGIASGVRGK
jgi:uncharacterized membrane protein YfcA